jgi:hypothetical protein
MAGHSAKPKSKKPSSGMEAAGEFSFSEKARAGLLYGLKMLITVGM